jgi:hypothetical protein
MCRAFVCRLFCFLLLRSPPYVMGVVAAAAAAAAVGYRRCVSHAVQAAVGKAESRQRETRAVMVDW